MNRPHPLSCSRTISRSASRPIRSGTLSGSILMRVSPVRNCRTGKACCRCWRTAEPGSFVIITHCTKCGAELKRQTINAALDFILPAALTTIEEQAFEGGAFTCVKLSEQTVSICWHAFADCPNLAYIYIPALATQIDEEAFGTMQVLTILGKTGSTAETYAQNHHFTFIAVP